MPLFTRKDFASHCGILPNALRTYIGRGKVVEGLDGMIDSLDPKNKNFYSNQKVKKEKVIEPADPKPKGATRKNIPSVEIEVKDSKPLKKTIVDPGADAYEANVRLVKHLDAEKRRVEIELMQIKADKMRGELVPIAMILPVIMQHNQHLVSEFKNAGDDMIRQMAKKYDFTGDDHTF